MLLSRTINSGVLKRFKDALKCITKRSVNDVGFEDIPEVSTALIKKSFKLNNVTFEEGCTCFITPCMVCSAAPKEAKLYINKTTGMYMCSLCKQHGQWDQLEARFTLKKSKKVRPARLMDHTELQKIEECLTEIRQNNVELKSLSEQDLVNLWNKFKLPVVPKTIFEPLDVRLSSKQTTNLEPLDVRINPKHTLLYFPLENAESEIVGYRTLHSSTKEETLLPDVHCGGLLTARVPRSKDTALVVPNVADFLVLLKARLSVNLVCLPQGVSTLSLYFLPSLERFKKLILWLGSDNRSWDAARHFAKKLGEKRCSLIRPNELLPHLNENQDFKSVISGAHAVYHKSITTFSSLRANVLSNVLDINKIEGVKWKRFPTLNKILLGHRRGELTIFTGPTGSGKTTFISEYSLDLAMQGVNTLWGSFEIKNEILAGTMLQQMAGVPLRENVHLLDSLADEFEKLPIYYMTFHGQQTIKVVMEAIEHATYVYDIAHVVIDNLQFMMGVSDEHKHMDRFWKQDAIIEAFRNFASRKNCHVTLVIHPRKERDDEDLTIGSIFGGAKASQEADNVLIIQDKRLQSIRGKKFLQVAKNRCSGDLGVMALDFDKKSLSFAPKKPKEKKSELPTDQNLPKDGDSVPET